MKKNLSEQFVSATLWNAILFPARLGVGVLASVIYYQRLSLDQVGVLFLLQSLATTIGLYADMGIERTLPRFLPEVEKASGREGVKRLMTRVIRLKLLVLLVLVAVLAVFAAPLTQALVRHEKKEIVSWRAEMGTLDRPRAEARSLEKKVAAKEAVVRELEDRGGLFLGAVGVLLVLGALFDVYMQFLTAYLKQRSWNLITLTSTLLQPVLVTAFLLAGLGIQGVLIGLVAAPFVSVLLAAWQVSRASRELEEQVSEAREPPALTSRFARFAAVNYLMQVTTWIYDLQFVVFLSAATLSLSDVALLGFAYKFAKDFLGYVWTPLTGVTTPILSRVHARGDNGALQEAHGALTRLIWLMLTPAGVGLLVLAPEVLRLLYPRYTGTTLLVGVFVAFTFGESLLSVPQNVLMVVERYRPVVIARLVAFLTIPLVSLLLPRYGILGVALAAGSTRFLSRVVTLGWGMGELGLRFPLAFAARVAAAAGLMGAVVLVGVRAFGHPVSGLSRVAAFYDLAFSAPLGALVFLLVFKMLGGLDQADRRRLRDFSPGWLRVLSRVV